MLIGYMFGLAQKLSAEVEAEGKYDDIGRRPETLIDSHQYS